MTDFTQDQLEHLMIEARSLVPSNKVAELEADIKAKEAYPNSLGRFLERFINAMENRDLDKYTAAPVVKGGVASGVTKPDQSNPWSAAGWNVSEQGRLAKRLGDVKAAAMAKAAGCVLGSTKPNPAFN
jgi:hypothetical protein